MSDQEKFFGDKYEQLTAAKPLLDAVDIPVPEFVGIDQSLIDRCLADNSFPSIEEADTSNMDHYEIEGRLKVGDDLVDHLVACAGSLSERFDAGPLIMRSSGRGDALGIGVYKSEVYGIDPDSARDAFSRVVASYFSPEGINYRRRASIAPGFGMLIQPLVGTVSEGVSDFNKDDRVNLFDTSFSGNAKLGTPRSPIGSMKLQPGFGCAVSIPGLPAFEFADSEDDSQVVKWAASDRVLSDTGPRNRQVDDSIRSNSYVYEPNYGWLKNYGEYHQVGDRNKGVQELTIGGLKEVLTKAHEALGSIPTYLEFVARQEKGAEVIYIVQKGDIAPAAESELTLDSISTHQIMLSTLRVEGGNGFSPKFDTIVCLTEEDKMDLYNYDSSDDARGGYLLAFGASRNPRSNPIRINRLKNARGVVTIETMDYIHCARPEEHLIGYSDKLGIPLISIYSRAGDAWMTLNGFSWDGDHKGRHEGSLIIRKGSFQIVTDANSQDGVILDLDKQS